MDFSPNKTPIEIIKERGFGGTYLRDIYFGIIEKRYKNSWKEFINKIDPYGWFQWYFRYWLAGRSKDDKLDSLKIETKFDAELMAKLEKSNSNSE